MQHEITLEKMEEIALCIVRSGLNEDEAVIYAKGVLMYMGSTEDSKPPIEIKPGVYCDDIPYREVLEVWDSLYDLGFGFHCDLHVTNAVKEYAIAGKMGICIQSGKVIISHDNNYFTTRVSYKDIIAAAKAKGE